MVAGRAGIRPPLVVFLGRPACDHKVAVLTKLRAQQLKALKPVGGIDTLLTLREALFYFLFGALGEGKGGDIYEGHMRIPFDYFDKVTLTFPAGNIQKF